MKTIVITLPNLPNLNDPLTQAFLYVAFSYVVIALAIRFTGILDDAGLDAFGKFIWFWFSPITLPITTLYFLVMGALWFLGQVYSIATGQENLFE